MGKQPRKKWAAAVKKKPKSKIPKATTNTQEGTEATVKVEPADPGTAKH